MGKIMIGQAISGIKHEILTSWILNRVLIPTPH